MPDDERKPQKEKKRPETVSANFITPSSKPNVEEIQLKMAETLERLEKRLQRMERVGERQIRGSWRGSSQEGITCYNCNKKGHYASDCKEPKRMGDRKTMSSITHRREYNAIGIEGRVGGVKTDIVLDTGAAGSFVSRKFKEKIPEVKYVEVKETPPEFVSATKTKLDTNGRIETEIALGQHRWKAPLIVTEELTHDVILGMDNLEEEGFVIDTKNRTVELPSKERIAYSPAKTILTMLRDELPNGVGTLSDAIPEPEKKQLQALLRKNRDLFAENPKNPGTTQVVEHVINTGDHMPIHEHPRKVSPMQRQVIDKEIEEMLKNGIISPSESPWAAPVVITKKKDGTNRFCVDYRRMNDITTKDVYPLPRIDLTLDALAGSTVFSTLDLASGYWQIPVKKEDRPKTAFSIHAGLYQYNVMPFGLSNAPATFQRLMDRILNGLLWKSCLVYLDDIIVFSKT